MMGIDVLSHISWSSGLAEMIFQGLMKGKKCKEEMEGKIERVDRYRFCQHTAHLGQLKSGYGIDYTCFALGVVMLKCFSFPFGVFVGS